VAVILGELIFILIPIGVTAWVFATHRPEGLQAMLWSPEWAFAAVVLAGQSGVRLLLGRGHELNRAKLWFVGTLVFALAVISVLVLATLLEKEQHAPAWVCGTQFVLFLIASVAFVVLGSLAHALAEE
jgi:hypothetical protein